MDIHEVAELVAGPKERLRFRQGTVVAVASDGRLTVTIAGSAVEITGVRALASVCPKVGAGVWLATDGLDLFAIGTMTPTGPAYCKVIRPTDRTLANNTEWTLDFTASAMVVEDTHGMFAAGASTVLTVKLPGVYLLTAIVGFGTSGVGYRSVKVTAGAKTAAISRTLGIGTGGVTTFVTASGEVPLAADDTIAVSLIQNSGGDLACVYIANISPSLTATWLRPVTT